jgi:hypothetical protein
MELFYDTINLLWSEDNMYITIAVVTFIMGVLHALNQGN